MSISFSFQSQLGGEISFYNKEDYVQKTKQDFRQDKPLPTSFSWNSESRMFYNILYLHALIGKVAILPASNLTLMRMIGFPKNYANNTRMEVNLEGQWKYKRLTVEMDGYKIDAVIVGKSSTLTNGRWILVSNGNGEYYEQKLGDYNFINLLDKLNGNGLVFNYPGVGTSSGLPNRQAMSKAYRVMLKFLEDKQRGIGAKEIIAYGHSIGGGVQADALNFHKLRNDVKYVFIKSRTFSDLSSTAAALFYRPLDSVVSLSGWNMDIVASSKRLNAPEIILQTADVSEDQELFDSSTIIYDDILPAEVTLAKVLLDDPTGPKQNKMFIGIPQRHNDGFPLANYLAAKIDEMLAKNTVLSSPIRAKL